MAVLRVRLPAEIEGIGIRLREALEMSADCQAKDSHHVGRQFLSPVEFAEVTGLSPATVRRRIAERRIPIYQPGGPRTRVLIPIKALGAPERSEPVPSGSPATDAPPLGKLAGPAPRWRCHETNDPESPRKRDDEIET